jgi:hypothetical protein
MATEKILNTRVQLKYDSYENWIATANQFKLRPGEVAVVNINGANGANLNNGTENTVVQPTILFKVGIGNPADNATWKTFNQLPWASALAADVHAWAKLPWDDFKVRYEAGAELDVSYDGEKITYSHEKKLDKGYTTGVPTDKSATAFGDSVTIKVPKLTANEYGHITAAEDTEYTITLPTPEAATNTVTILTEGPGIDITDTATDGNHNYKVSASIGTGLVFEGTTDADKKIAHQAKPTTGTAAGSTTGTGRTYVTEVLVDNLGHIAGVKTATEEDQEIDWETEVPAHETELTITDVKPTTALEDGLVYAVTKLEEDGTNGHDVTATYEAVATKAYVDKRASGAVDYLGTVGDSESVDIKFTANTQIGDFARASNTFTYVYGGDVSIEIHAGDLLIRDSGNEPFLFTIVHGEEGDITEIVAGDGLTGGGSVDSVTIDHEVPTGATAGDHKGSQSRTYITNVKTDKFGHVVGFETGTEEDQEVGVTSVNASGDNEITLTADPTTGDVVITGAHASHAAGTAKTASTTNISGYSATGSIKIPKIVTNAAGHVTEISEETVSIQMPALQELPTVNDGQLTVTGSEGIAVDYQEPFSANTADEHFLGLKIADKGVTTAKIADHAVGAHQTKACTDYTGDDAEVWVFNCGSATVNV